MTDPLIGTMKRVATVLAAAGVPFALAGSFAVYARGGTSSEHDVDFVLREQDVPRALDALVEQGFRAERPPEDWLVKVYDADRMVDLIFRPVQRQVTDDMLAATEVLDVEAVRVPVLPATELMVHKLLTFSQHHCDFATALPMARSLREQIDWPQVYRRTSRSAYAYAFLVLLDRLRVVRRHDMLGRSEPDRSDVLTAREMW